MTLDLYPLDNTVESPAATWRAWRAWSFRPRAAVERRRADSPFVVRTTPAPPLLIKAPVGSRLVADGRGRLVTWFNSRGLDAAAVAHLATRGERGFAILEGPAS